MVSPATPAPTMVTDGMNLLFYRVNGSTAHREQALRKQQGSSNFAMAPSPNAGVPPHRRRDSRCATFGRRYGPGWRLGPGRWHRPYSRGRHAPVCAAAKLAGRQPSAARRRSERASTFPAAGTDGHLDDGVPRSIDPDPIEDRLRVRRNDHSPPEARSSVLETSCALKASMIVVGRPIARTRTATATARTRRRSQSKRRPRRVGPGA